MRTRYLFDNYKHCTNCHRPLALDYKEDLCPACIEYLLFQQVKEFIRANDVNEYQVSDHFGIPLIQVKGWIREGRIQYKETNSQQVTMHCQLCGTPVAFGTLCSKCLKEKNLSGSIGFGNKTDSGNMRHLQIKYDE